MTTRHVPAPVIVYADETLEDLQRGGYRLIQSSSGFRHGTDSVLLAAWAAGSATGQKPLRIADLGAGSGAVSLLLSARRTHDRIVAFEKDEHALDLLRRNIWLNRLEQRLWMVPGDIRDRLNERHLPADLPDYHQYDVVVSNPPYHVPGQSYGGQSDSQRYTSIKNRPAVYEDELPLEILLQTARRLLRQRGRFIVVHRPHRLADLLEQLRRHRFEPTRLCFVHPRADRPPVMVLLEARLYGRPGGLRIDPPLLLEQKPGIISPELAALYGTDTPLDSTSLRRGVTFSRMAWPGMMTEGDFCYDNHTV